MSKQSAGKTVVRLIAVGYAERTQDPADARRKIVRLTPHGLDSLTRSAAIFDRLRAGWSEQVGEACLRAMEDDLRTVSAPLPSGSTPKVGSAA
ncbi:MarR family winged helix-turn-helix transcriptional regulator [Nocardia sp. NPDC001965]